MFFLNGVESAAINGIAKAHALQDLHQRYLQQIQSARSSALQAKIVTSLFDSPAITIPSAQAQLGISYNSAKNNIKRLVELGILSPLHGVARAQRFLADQILRIADEE